ncbi:DNA repair protein rad5 [Penicillium chermesinum]|nr:DNA repair protein rad5 [Penicillium chermesinum]
MSEELDQRPAKRQRFFADEPHPPALTDGTLPSRDASPEYPQLGQNGNENGSHAKHQPTQDQVTATTESLPTAEGFDADLFTSIIGEQLPPDAIQTISAAASQNVERAVNIYFDGSWKRPAKTTIRTKSTSLQKNGISHGRSADGPSSSLSPDSALRRFPSSRFLGTFGVGGWATRSGPALLQHGDPVKIDRVRSQPPSRRGKGGRVFVNHKSDVLTRFTTVAGQEVGRLPKEEAEWVSTLIDQKVCHFEAVCVYSDERLRVNDTIFLQLRDDNRSVGLFEEKESTEEKNLRLRQVALVKLFAAIDMKPTSINPTTEKHKREGLLRAAEMAEQYDGAKKERTKSNKDTEESSEEDDTQELEQDQLDALYQKAQSFDFSMPEAEPAPTFRLSLRKYQKQALHWMLSKEMDKKQVRERSMHPLWEEYTWPTKDSDDKDLPVYDGIENFYVNPYSGDLSVDFPTQEQHCLGGILADEMGLGKTIEMLSLIHSHKIEPESNGPASVNDLARLPDTPGVIPAPYTTLVVAPTSLLSQWESEALKASQEGTMRVRMYYGADKTVNLRELCCASQRTTAPHVIVTSFGVVLSEFRSLAAQQSGASGGLFSVEFFRVILDEAHTIKNRRSKSARACYELKAVHRWVLTGTPIINRLEDLFSLVRFLKVEPWSNFSFWKTFITVPFESKEYARALNVVQSVLEPLVLRRTKNMKTPEGDPPCSLPPRTINIEEIELSEKEREIYDCIYTRAKRTYNDNMERGTLLQSYSTIFAQILRLRQTCCHPILTRNKDIVADEEVAAAVADATNEFKDDMDLQELINQFTASTQNPEAEDRTVKFTAHALRQIQTESTGECPICCEEPMINPAVTACWHSACKKCLEDFVKHHMDKGTQPRCFNCRADIDAKNLFEVVRHPASQALPVEEASMSDAPGRSQPAPPQTSAKIYALINHLSRVPPNTKSVVFSQFTSFLDLIGQQLDKSGVSFVRLDGSMPQKARKAVLEEFQQTETFEEDIEDSADEMPVMLISLKAGGVGLNLTTASNVFMMDPWWSFATEAQAIDRVHRMGQTRDVSVTRFIVKDSIEGRMLRVQERKMNIAGSLGLRVGGDDPEEDKKKERITELRMLFE